MAGVFIVAALMSSGEYIETPQRGFLYFRIPAGMEKAALKESAELKPFAGTGQVVGFAQYWTVKTPYRKPVRSSMES